MLLRGCLRSPACPSAFLRHTRRLKSSMAASVEMETPAEEISHFLGAQAPYTAEMKYLHPHKDDVPSCFPVFRLIDDEGVPVEGAKVPELERDFARRMMTTMVRVSEFDIVYNDAQRQGRLSFYFTNRGEEACAVGSAAALADNDWIWPQYRELGAGFWRGLTFEQCANQCCHNALDPSKGRQLPMHVGSPDLHLQYVKSNLGQQVPAAAGAGYAMKMFGQNQCAITYFGEGCASEGDIPSAFNVAAIHGAPTIFFCRNNGYAISTHTRDQYTGDGIAPRGVAYGLPTIRVDGNDLLAVYAASIEARRIAVEENKPVLIEAMTYRIGPHSTSDDDSKYRDKESPEADIIEKEYWERRSPILRFGKWLSNRGWWTAEEEAELRAATRKHAIESLRNAEAADQPHIAELFNDVYDEPTWNIKDQKENLKQHLLKYPHEYPEIPMEQIKEL